MLLKLNKLTIVRVLCVAMMICSMVNLMPLQAEEVTRIKVGYVPRFNNLIEDMDSLNEKGYGYEIFQKMEEVSNYEFEFVPITSNVDAMLATGAIDVAGLFIRTDERRKNWIYSETQYGKTYVTLSTKNADIIYDDHDAIDGKTVATYEDNFANKAFDDYCIGYGIDVEYVYGTMYNYADYYLNYSAHESMEEQYNALNVGVYNLYLVTSMDNENLMKSLDEIFLHIVATEGNFFMELEDKYLAQDINYIHRDLNPSDIELLKSRPLQVGYLADKQPITYQKENGEAAGAMVEILNYLAKLYGFEVEYHTYSLDDDEKHRENFDILVTLYGDLNHEQEYYKPTEPFLNLDMYAQVRGDIYREREATGQLGEGHNRIGTLEYLMVDFEGFQSAFPENEIIYYTNLYDTIEDYKAGKLDMFLASANATTNAEILLGEMDSVTTPVDFQVPVSFWISKEIGNEYLSLFNIMLDKVPDEIYASILLSNSNAFFPEESFMEFLLDVWPYILRVLIALAIPGVFIVYRLEKKKRKDILKAYHTDVLTGLATTPKFIECVTGVLEKAKEGEYQVISLDIDLFKTINSYYSIERGTEVIKKLAKSLKLAFASENTCILRRNADQFVVFTKNMEREEVKDVYFSYILPSLQEMIGLKYNLSLSFGMYTIANCSEKVSTMIGYADVARLQGKSIHKTTFIEFNDHMKAELENKINVTFRMEQALKDREFSVVYQPKVDFDTLKIGGAEALVRWYPRLGEVIYPDAFIPIFESNGFIMELDLYVLEDVCKFIAINYRKFSIPRISVNLSAHSVLDSQIAFRILEIIDRYHLKPSDIELEITESAIVREERKFLKQVKCLKELGFAIAIDDFGAGVSSLNRLSAMEADVLKLDKAFFDLKEQGGRSATIVEDVIRMADHLQMQVVAEGVETFSQAMWLRQLKCTYAQGYYFDKPMDEASFKKILSEAKTYQIEIR